MTNVSEPVWVADIVRTILVTLVTLGWVDIPNDVIDSIVTAVGLIISVVLTLWVRKRTTPST